MLWYVLRPGTDVYVKSIDGVYAGVVRAVKSPFLDGLLHSAVPWWTVEIFCLSTDGWTISRILKIETIYQYEGTMKAIDLPVCPVDLWDRSDGGQRRETVLKRNKMHFDVLTTVSMLFNYRGEQHSGKIVVDHANGRRVGQQTLFSELGIRERWYDRFDSYDHIELREVNAEEIAHRAAEIPGPEADEVERRYMSQSDARPVRFEPANEQLNWKDITEHQLLLLHPSAPAFLLDTKQWVQISFEYVDTVAKSDESINNLVLDKDILQTVCAISSRRSRQDKAWNADFIEGKGAGQIVLLHGPPGVGKTYTVESISLWLGRPLLALTIADIGTTETQIEQELMLWFDLAEAWNAVLLVDEADIFLEQRKTRDLSRNSLVSALLRRMEYFGGLLFLTTNRVGQIDDAFMSRIHVAIGYEKLTPAVRREIWKGIFDKLARERAGKIKVGPGAKRYILQDDDVANLNLNGREIRNALQTAITLAEYENFEEGAAEDESVLVEETHFRRVLQMSEKFQNYVTTIRRQDEAKRAAARGDRNDYDGRNNDDGV